ncbi:hypothetical protein BHAOGJBA_1384 [Methylobacterium hispanicum]|uniref:Uncharacterized protein n=1 Tax=Methylobacterium hispanicum TaxID=270350 RepID=A0AAV4ZHT5_9HYPH|nr:hypothetical protein [Methylobacterium hispanicum]GJD87878.1 hypothetical protein BHAOGJBA_1384 [Methylobacterium hispanicum]
MIDNAPEIESALNGRGEPAVFIGTLAARAAGFELVGERGVRLHTPAGPVDVNLPAGADAVRQAIADGGQLHVFEVDLPQGDEPEAAALLRSEFDERVAAYVVGPAPRR